VIVMAEDIGSYVAEYLCELLVIHMSHFSASCLNFSVFPELYTAFLFVTVFLHHDAAFCVSLLSLM